MRKGLLVAVVVLAALGAALATGRLDPLVDRLLLQLAEPPQRIGPVLRAEVDGRDRVYVLTRQSQSRVLGRWSPQRMTRTFFDIRLFDGATARPVAQQRLLAATADSALDGTLLGRDGPVVWLFLNQVMAISAADGRVLADAAALAAANPALDGLLLAERRYYAFDHGLVVTAADGRRHRIAGDLTARPLEAAAQAALPTRLPGLPDLVLPPELQQDLARQQGIAAPTLGEVPAFFTPSSPTAFRVREVQVDQAWFALLSDPPEAADQQAMRQARPRGHAYLSGLGWAGRRYRLWQADLAGQSGAPPGWPADFPDNWPRSFRLVGPRVLTPARDYLDAGLLGDKDAPFVLADPPSLLLAHRDRLGGGGHVQLSRIALDDRILWEADLPLGLIQSVLPPPATAAGSAANLVLFGQLSRPDPDQRAPGEPEGPAGDRLVSVNLKTGTVGAHVFETAGE